MSETLEDQERAMVYASGSPDVLALSNAYTECIAGLDEYFNACRQAHDDRRNLWPNKSWDLRKHGVNAFPWDGASDMEVNVIGERIDYFVSLMDQALQRSHIKAFPTSVAAMPRAAVTSAFLKWMRSTYIPRFRETMELGANYLLEKGLMVTYVGWKSEQRSYLQRVSLEEIAQVSPEMAEMIVDAGDDKAVYAALQQVFPGVSMKRAKRALKDLRQSGVAEIPIPRKTVDCPVVHACAPDADVFLPPYVTDPQRSPYIFWRAFYTPQELEKKVANEGWDADWVEEAITKVKGQDSYKIDAERYTAFDRVDVTGDSDLVMIVHAFQRLIDEEDGSEGIYVTTFHPDLEGHAHHELLNGHDEYPFVFTRLSNNQGRIYETQMFSDILRGPQIQIKTERDSRIDRASLAVMPPLMHPVGRPPTDWGPARRIPYRRLGEITFGPQPPPDSGSIEIESSMTKQADRAVGLDHENPLSQVRQQFVVGKFLDHVRDVLSMAFKLFQRVGPDELFFQVTGNPNPQIMSKGSPDDNYSIVVAFDSQSADPETAETQIKNMAALMQFDRNGRIDVDKLIEIMAASVNPIIADYVLQPAEEAQSKVTKNVTDDLAKLFAGIEVPAQPSGAQIALQVIQAYAQQPDVAQRLQNDQSFAERISKYAGQYQFQMTQAQNAQIGRLGTSPAQMGQIQTQAMQ